jgi:hypothetical protein
VSALLVRARADEIALLPRIGPVADDGGLAEAVRVTWRWLSDTRHRPLLALWVEAYARSLTDPTGRGLTSRATQ